MRTRALTAIAFVLLPSVLTAQRIRPPRVGGPDRLPVPAELPPQPAPIARELAYKRLRLSVESYPLVSFVNAPGFGTRAQPSSWTTFGMGERLDYRVTRFLSATMDMTSSFLGGPANTHTAELGARLHPARGDRRLYPFFDLRVGYLVAYNTYHWPNDIYGNPAFTQSTNMGFNDGFGGVAGAGFELSLTRRFSLTTGASVMRSDIRAHGFNTQIPLRSNRYWMSAYRYTLGLRYNPVRLITTPPI
jgi:hypothetical protein